jgi:hypothetical protein
MTVERAIGDGIVGGGMSEFTGGNFRDGFIGAAAGSLLSPLASETDIGQKLIGSTVLGRTAFAAAVGGTAAALTGGKFANAAISAAFVHLVNAELVKAFYRSDTMNYMKSLANSVKYYSDKYGADPRALMMALGDEHHDYWHKSNEFTFMQLGQDGLAWLHPGSTYAATELMNGRSPDLGPSNINVDTAQWVLGQLGYSNDISSTSYYLKTIQGTSEVGAYYMAHIQRTTQGNLVNVYTNPDVRAAHYAQYWRQGIDQRNAFMAGNTHPLHGVGNSASRLRFIDGILK